MKTMRRHGTVRRTAMALIFACGASLFGPGTAAAAPVASRGIALESKALSARVATSLRADITRARQADAKAFADVRSLVARGPELHARGRGRRVPLALVLAKMGKNAVLPLLDVLAFDAPSGLGEADRALVRRDVVEAVGLLRDARALPVLATLLGQADDAAMTRTVAEAVARQDTKEAATLLVAELSRATGERQAAIASGMGMCHKESIAQALADVLLAKGASRALSLSAVRALGHVGNAWAWQTLSDRTEEVATRARAAESLVATFVGTNDEELREAITKSLLLVDAPATGDLIRAARSHASPSTAEALDGLGRRLAKNPLR